MVMETTVFVAIITAGASIILSALSFFLTKKKKREAELRKQKLDSYTELLSALSNLTGKDVTFESKKRLAQIVNHIWLIAPYSVTKALTDFLDESSDSNRSNFSQEGHDRLLTILLHAIRKDLGVKSRKFDQNFEFRLWSATKN